MQDEIICCLEKEGALSVWAASVHRKLCFLQATGMGLLVAPDTLFLTTMLRMNCIHLNVHGHVVSTFTVDTTFCKKVQKIFFFLLQSDTSSIFLTFLHWYTGNDIKPSGLT